jgi:NADH:ubiquinone oxidoreductase subunit 5 (subunit L)/multisubunit Na+/H+ antiporter MnhA subunit
VLDGKDQMTSTEPQSQGPIAVLGVVVAAVVSILTGEDYYTPFSVVLGGALLLVLIAFDTPSDKRVDETKGISAAFALAFAISVTICAGVLINLLYILPALRIEGYIPETLTRGDVSYWVFFVGDILYALVVATIAWFVYKRRRAKIERSQQLREERQQDTGEPQANTS